MKTRKEKVLNALETAGRGGQLSVRCSLGDWHNRTFRDGWVPGYVLQAPSVGGSSGLRRLRELREDGHEIEMKKVDDGATRLYRLAPQRRETLW